MYEKSIAGKIVTAADSVVIVRATPTGSAAEISRFTKGTAIGRASGNSLAMGDGKWYQVNLYTPVNGVSSGYVRAFYNGAPNVTIQDAPQSPVAETNAQNLADDIVKMDRQTFENLVKCYKHIKRAKTKGITPEKNLLAQLAGVYISLSDRQNRMKNISGTSYRTAQYKDNEVLDGLSNICYTNRPIRGIGWIQLVVIIIVFIVGAGSAAAVYYSLKPDYTDAKSDLKVSQTLEKALASLTPEQQQEVKDDLNTQIKDAYNQGKTDQKFGDFFSFSGMGKVALFGVLGYLGISALTKKSAKNGK